MFPGQAKSQGPKESKGQHRPKQSHMLPTSELAPENINFTTGSTTITRTDFLGKGLGQGLKTE